MARISAIRKPGQREAEAISALAMRSKAYWGYSNEFMEACREELTVTTENLIADDPLYMVAEGDSKLLGYYAIAKSSEDKYELEALFVEPDFIGKGVGKALMDHAKMTVIELGGKSLLIQSDPNAGKFYRAAGGEQIGTRESVSIAGRSLPLFRINLVNEEAA